MVQEGSTLVVPLRTFGLPLRIALHMHGDGPCIRATLPSTAIPSISTTASLFGASRTDPQLFTLC